MPSTMETNSSSVDAAVPDQFGLSGWNDLNPDLIRRIVNSVKANQRWSHDGRALRCLNKHWSFCVNQLITTIHPALNRAISIQDLESLAKFPEIKSIDMWPFIVADNAFSSNIFFQTRWWRKLTKSEKKERVTRVLRQLTRMPRLSQLMINNRLSIVPERLWKDGEVMALLHQLNGVISLRSGSYSTRYFNIALLSAGWPIQELSRMVLETYRLQLYTHLTSLKELDLTKNYNIHYSRLLHNDITSFIQTAPAMSIRLSIRTRSLELIAELKSLRVLNLRLERSVDLTPLTNLVLMKHLEIKFRPPYQPREEAMEKTLELLSLLQRLNLVSFTLFGSFDRFDPTAEDLKGLTRLKSLKLRVANINASPLLQAVPNLQFLDMRSAKLSDLTLFWSYVDRPETVEGRHLHNLIGIRLPYAMSCFSCLRSVCRLTNLKVLFVQEENFETPEAIKELDRLTCLRYLSVDFYDKSEKFSYLTKLELLRQLETLCLVNEKSMDREIFRNTIEEIGMIAPSLKITIENPHYWYMVYESFFPGSLS